MVKFDGNRLGWIDTVFEGLDEFWVCDEHTNQTVFEGTPGTGDVRSFQAAELTFMGEWSRCVQAEAVVEIPPEVVEAVVAAEDFVSQWEERTKVTLQIEYLVAGAPGRILIGPGFPPDVKAAERMLSDYVQNLQRKQHITETVEVPADLLPGIQEEDGWEAEWQERAEVVVHLEPPSKGASARIAIGPGPKAVVTKAVSLLLQHLQERAEHLTAREE